MKQVSINPNDPGDLNDKLHECQVMKKIRHPNIVRFKYHFSSQNTLCILFDNCDKGDLERYLLNQNGAKLSENRIKKFIVEMILAVDCMHS